MLRATLILTLMAAPAQAGPLALLGADDFEARVTGRTIYWTQGEEPAGAEQYLPGRRVIWRFGDNACTIGHWYAKGPYICFLYENDDGPICWTFAEAQGGLAARPKGGAVSDVLRAGAESTAPLGCGIGVGV